MKNVTKKLSGVTLGLMMVGVVHADTFNVTATVSSTIALVETTALDLGTLFMPDATCAGTGSVLTIQTDGTAASIAAGGGACSTDNIVSLAPDTPGIITVTGAAPFGTVTITSGVTTTDLVHSSNNPALPVIEHTSSLTLPANAATLTLDANGDGDIIVGGTFSAEDNAAAAYADGVYTGTYDIDVSY